MKRIRALTILHGFTERDIKKFQKIVNRRYNKDAPLRVLSDKIFKCRDQLSPITTGEVLRQICKISINQKTLSNQLTELAMLMDDFMIREELSGNAALRDSILLSANARRGIVNEVDRIDVRCKEETHYRPLGLWDRYYRALTSHHRYYFHLSGDPNSDKAVFSDMIENFDVFVKEMRSYYSVEMHARSTLPNENWEKKILEYDFDDSVDSAIVDLAYDLRELVKNYSEEAYVRLRSTLEGAEIKLSSEIKNTILSYLINYLNYKNRQSHQIRKGELLDLYMMGLRGGYLSKGTKMAERLYTNIISLCCKAGKEAWAAEFVENYARAVDSKYEQKIKIAGRAYLDFYAKRYDSVLQQLSTFTYHSESLRFKMRWLHLSACYELNKDEPDFMLTELKKFVQYIKSPRSQTSKSVKYGTLNSCKVLAMLIGLSDKAEVLAVRDSLRLFNGKWIDEKIIEKFGN